MKKEQKKGILIELGIVILALIIYISIKYNWTAIIPPCYVYQNFGLLCPSCGGTRCMIELVKGHFESAFYYHPIFFATVLYLLVANSIYVVNLFRKNKIATWLYPKTKFWIIFCIIMVAFTIIRNIF